MLKSIWLSDYKFPYAILISKFLQYFEVNLDEELTGVVKPFHEINNGSLFKMGFVKINDKWVSKNDDIFVDATVGPSGTTEDYSS